MREGLENYTPDTGVNFIATRHTSRKDDSPMSEEYDGITEKGVEMAREKANSIYEHIQSSPEGTVVFMSGISELPRSEATMQVYVDQLKKLIEQKGSDDIVVINENEIEKETGITKKTEMIARQIGSLNGKKVVVMAPLAMSGFGVKGVWSDKDGNTPYYDALQEQGGGGDNEAVLLWLNNFKNGINTMQTTDGVIEGPNPLDVAKEQLRSIARLKEFASRYIGNRPLEIGSVGHAVNLDALAVYLADNGQMKPETFEALQGSIGLTEMISLTANPDGTTTFSYGDRFQKELNNQDNLA